MKPTFPVREFPWIAHLPAVLFVLIAIVVSVSVYDSLPDRLATTFDFKNRPVGYMNKDTYMAMIIGYMSVMAVFFLALDRLYLYFIFPVPLMSAISGAIQVFILIMHMMILDIHILPDMSVLASIIVMCAIPCVYLVIHFKVFRRDEDEDHRGMPLWLDVPPHGWISRVFFFVSPILPNKVIAYNEGLVLKARLYRFMIPWAQIRSIEHATTGEAMSKMALRISSAPSRSVKLYLADQKLPVIFSIADEPRLIDEWKQRRG
jgi:hypothetical protein